MKSLIYKGLVAQVRCEITLFCGDLNSVLLSSVSFELEFLMDSFGVVGGARFSCFRTGRAQV